MSDQSPLPQEPLPTQIVMGGVTLNPGDCIGPYRYERPIGRGGMSHVILARDPGGHAVALKVLKANRFRTGLARFRREFRALARLKHPNVIRVESYGDIHGHPYIAMEYVEGTDLYQEIRGFSRTDLLGRWARVEQVLIELSRALAYIHQRGLIHRDLKPSNVLISGEGVCKLTDFGIVKELDPKEDVQLSTTLVGTWAYASPEQITGAPTDNRSDLYSLGVILYTMLTGRRPFVAKDMAAYLELHKEHEPDAPVELVPGTPVQLNEICMRLLQKEPRDRFQSAQEILYRLEQIDIDARIGAGHEEGWEPKLVGRSEPIETLRNSVSAMSRKQGGVVLIEGKEGMGKTRLLRAALHHASLMGIPVHHARMIAGAGSFEALIEVATGFGHALGDDVPPALEQAIRAFVKDGGQVSGDARYQLYDGIRDALGKLLDHGPRIMALDDFHNAPPPLVDMLSYLVRSIVVRDERPFLVLLTARTEGLSKLVDEVRTGAALSVHPTRVELAELTEDEVQALVSEMLGSGQAAKRLAALLHRETEGNPFFVAEFLRSLVQQGVIEAKDGDRYRLTVNARELEAGQLAIPPGVRQVVRSRLAPLSAEERELVDALSVAGRETDIDVLLDVVDLDEEPALDAVDALVSSGVLVDRRISGQVHLDFAHRKVGDVAFRELGPTWRATLHRRIAVALEMRHAASPVIAEVIGEHYLRAGENGKAFRYLATSAQRLWQRALTGEAWTITERALLVQESAASDLTELEHQRARLRILQVRAYTTLNRGSWMHAENLLASLYSVAQQLGDRALAEEARLDQGIALKRLGRGESGEAMIDDVIELARARGDRRTVIEGLRRQAMFAWERGDLSTCEHLANQGLDSATGSDLDECRAGILVVLTAVQAERGQLAAATTGLAEAEAIFQRLRNKRAHCVVLCNLAELLLWQGAMGEALRRADAAVELARDVDFQMGIAAGLRVAAMAQMDAGDVEGAGVSLDEALRICMAQGQQVDQVATRFLCGRLAHRLNDPNASIEHLQLGLEAAEHGDPESYTPMLQAMLARAFGERGDTEEAQALMGAVEAQLEDLAVPRRTQVMVVLSLGWQAQERLDEALRFARSAARIAGSRGFRLWALYARALVATLAKGGEAEAAQIEAVDLAQDLCSAVPAHLEDQFRARPQIAALLGEDHE